MHSGEIITKTHINTYTGYILGEKGGNYYDDRGKIYSDFRCT